MVSRRRPLLPRPDGTINPKNTASLSDRPRSTRQTPSSCCCGSPLVRRGHGAIEKRWNAGTPHRAAHQHARFNGFEKAAAGILDYNNQGGSEDTCSGAWLRTGTAQGRGHAGAIERQRAIGPEGMTDCLEIPTFRAYPPSDATILVRGIVLKELTPFGPDGPRKRRATDKQEQVVDDPAMPVVWTPSTDDRGTTIGSSTSTWDRRRTLRNEGLRRLIVNGVTGLASMFPARRRDHVDETSRPSTVRRLPKGLRPSVSELGKRCRAAAAASGTRFRSGSIRAIGPDFDPPSPAAAATIAPTDDVVAGLNGNRRSSYHPWAARCEHGLCTKTRSRRGPSPAEEDPWRRAGEDRGEALEGTRPRCSTVSSTILGT